MKDRHFILLSQLMFYVVFPITFIIIGLPLILVGEIESVTLGSIVFAFIPLIVYAANKQIEALRKQQKEEEQ